MKLNKKKIGTVTILLVALMVGMFSSTYARRHRYYDGYTPTPHKRWHRYADHLDFGLKNRSYLYPGGEVFINDGTKEPGYPDTSYHIREGVEGPGLRDRAHEERDEKVKIRANLANPGHIKGDEKILDYATRILGQMQRAQAGLKGVDSVSDRIDNGMNKDALDLTKAETCINPNKRLDIQGELDKTPLRVLDYTDISDLDKKMKTDSEAIEYCQKVLAEGDMYRKAITDEMDRLQKEASKIMEMKGSDEGITSNPKEGGSSSRSVLAEKQRVILLRRVSEKMEKLEHKLDSIEEAERSLMTKYQNKMNFENNMLNKAGLASVKVYDPFNETSVKQKEEDFGPSSTKNFGFKKIEM